MHNSSSSLLGGHIINPMTQFASSSPRQAAFLVYINGIEVPAKSVSMRYGVWQVPEMSIEMVADPVLTRLGAEDRVQVVVFYLDDCDVSTAVEPQFRLFGEGEITGWGYRNTSGGRSIIFTVVNQIQVFSQLFIQFMTTLDDLAGHDSSHADITGFATATNQIVYPYALFNQGLVPGSDTKLSKITRPFEFLYNAVKGMMSAAVPEGTQTVPAANFFARWARLTNFHNRFVATASFDQVDDEHIFPVLRALQNVSAADIISKSLIPQIQNKGSIWDMLQIVYQAMLMEVAMIPGMPLVTTDLLSGLIEETNFAEHKVVQSEADATEWVSGVSDESRKTKPKRLPNYFVKPQSFFSIPPSCNVVFPSQLLTIAYEENYSTQPTRLYFNDETLVNILKLQKNGVTENVSNALAVGYPPEVDQAQKAHDKFPKFSAKNFLIYPEEFFKGPVMYRRNAPPWLFFLRYAENKGKDNGVQTVDGTVKNTPAPFQTANNTVPSPADIGSHLLPMNTDKDVGKAGAGGQRTYNDEVEKLRPFAKRFEVIGIPIDLQLAWITEASGGILSSSSNLNDRGYFRIKGPTSFGSAPTTFQSSEAASIQIDGVPLTIADTGADYTTDPGAARLSYDKEFSYSAGIRLVQNSRKKADAAVVQFKLDTWTDADKWRLAYLQHVFPAAVLGTADVSSFIAVATKIDGHPPTSWNAMYKAISGALSDERLNFLKKATAVGGVVAGASGTMTTTQDSSPITAPAIKSATATPSASSTPVVQAAPPSSPIIPTSTYTEILAQHESVYQLYAKFEFFREKYSTRSGAATIVFNPYVVPGFPAAIFDSRASRIDLMCYVTTVQHQMNHSGTRGTTLSFLYGRQMQEMLDVLATEFSRGETKAGSAPAEPIREVRKTIQSFEQSEVFYQRMFYGNQKLYGKDAAFDFRKVMAYAPLKAGDPPEAIFVDGPDEASEDANKNAIDLLATLIPERDQRRATILDLQNRLDLAQKDSQNIQPVSAGTVKEFVVATSRLHDQLEAKANISEFSRKIALESKQLVLLDTRINAAQVTVQSTLNTAKTISVTHNVVGDRELSAAPAYEEAFNNRDAAMRYNYRPICTIDEYIIFLNSQGVGLIPKFGHTRSVGAKYYERIRTVTPPSPNFVPPSGANGFGGLDAPGVNAEFPQERADWDKALLAYRDNILNSKLSRT